jgi:hypothetical protein
MFNSKDIIEVFNGYSTCALWSSTDQSDESGGFPLDSNYTLADIDSDALHLMTLDCIVFLTENENDVLLYCGVVYTENWTPLEQVGHDLWLSRNGHGAGFFDRTTGSVGDRLQIAAEQMGETCIYPGDDGKLYI